jgi:hypothetical protein
MVIVAEGLMIPRFSTTTGIGYCAAKGGKVEGVSPSTKNGADQFY